MGLTAAAFLLIAAASGGHPPQAQLPVRIFDYVPVPPATLQRALSVSETIFRKAGVETTWVTCRPLHEENPACNSPLPSSHSVVKIISRSMDEQMVASHALGCALRVKEKGIATYIFHQPVEQFAHRTPVDPAVLFGMVLTHELGHFFGLDDGFSGIMVPSFQRPELMLQAASGSLTFDQGQAQHLRRAIERFRSRD